MKAVLLGAGAGLATFAALRGMGARPLTRLPTAPPRRRMPRRSASAPQWRRLAGLAVALGVLAPPLVVAPPLAALGLRHLRRHRAARDHQRATRAALPEAVDLLLLALGAGLSLPLAHPQVARHCSAPVGPALQVAADSTAQGVARADALVTSLAPLGDRALALAHVLVDHLRYGVPLTPGLERLQLELRLDRRRHAEQQARRVPVRLLGPLVVCILPAFAVLTVVPLLAASLRSLPT
ncbi:MAG: type II secretion system F family protein [Acidimicrobiales bacterium]